LAFSDDGTFFRANADLNDIVAPLPSPGRDQLRQGLGDWDLLWARFLPHRDIPGARIRRDQARE
jgi:hypothetical protein